jgi:hypothetical protein
LGLGWRRAASGVAGGKRAGGDSVFPLESIVPYGRLTTFERLSAPFGREN